MTTQNHQVELPRNYVCYLELTGFQGTNEEFIVGKVTELSVESIDDPNLPASVTKELCLLPGTRWTS